MSVEASATETRGGCCLATLSAAAAVVVATEPGMKILLDHPETNARIAAINKMAPARPSAPFVDRNEWLALKRICRG
jgi:hypothetical protein